MALVLLGFVDVSIHLAGEEMRSRLFSRRLSRALSFLALSFALSWPWPALAEKLQVRGDYNYPPYAYLDHGVPTGFEVDVMRAVAGVMGLDVEIRLDAWSTVRAELEHGEIDAVTGMIYSANRAKLVDFSEPLIVISHAIFVKDGSSVRGPEDLATARILVQEDDIMDDYAKEHYPGARITAVKTQEQALRLLSQDGYDAALLGKLQALYWIHKLHLTNVESVGPPLSPMRYCFAVANGRPGLLAKLNEGLAILRSSGRYEEIYEKWFGAYERESAFRLTLRYAVWAAGPVLALFAASFVWNWSLRRKVAQKTEALSRVLAASRESERALIASEKRYRAVFENIMDGYYQADMQGRVVWCNPAAAAMLGYEKPEDALGWELSQLYADPGQRSGFMERLLREGSVQGFQAGLRRQDGECFTAEANSRLLRDPTTGEPVGVEGVFRDITRRKRMEEIMAQTEKMLSVGGLAAGMAHEINNPLGIILASCQNLTRRLSPAFPKTRRRAETLGLDPQALDAFLETGGAPRILDGMTEAAERAARIVRNMLEFSRQDSERLEVCDVNAVLEKAVELARGDLSVKDGKGRRIAIVREYAKTPPRAAINQTGITQVLLNLLRNAAQALGAREGEEAPRIVLRTALKGNRVRIEVEDNGPGMDEMTRRRAFEPFFTTKAPGVGTGLGLSVSYFIVTQNHEGSIYLDSQPGKGTTFTILLPAGEAGAEQAA